MRLRFPGGIMASLRIILYCGTRIDAPDASRKMAFPPGREGKNTVATRIEEPAGAGATAGPGYCPSTCCHLLAKTYSTEPWRIVKTSPLSSRSRPCAVQSM